MGNALHKIKVKVDGLMMKIFSIFPFKNTILFESEGDFSDNAFAFYCYLKKEGYLLQMRQ